MSAAWRFGVLRSAHGGPPPRGPLVVKIGGSLLGRPQWPDAIAALLEALRPRRRPLCLLIGGGRVVDGLRAIDAAAPQPAERMHRLAIDAMGLTARVVAEAIGVPLAGEPDPAVAAAVLDVPTWLGAGDRMRLLPVGWHVTSDSIAACVASVGDGGLMIAKSVPPPASPDDLEGLAAAGWVDRAFPAAAATVRSIEWAAPDDATLT